MDLLLLRALRLHRLSGPDALARATGLERDAVLHRLVEMDEEGLVELRTGRIAGWTLTPGGQTRLSQLAAEELASGDTRAVVERSYARFGALNGQFKELCTRWQLRSRDPLTPNDHGDVGYDQAIVDGLSSLHRGAMSVLSETAAALPRFGAYSGRLGGALERLQAGGLEWFTKPGIGSYHDVWMELHEDFLMTLGRERGAEDA